MDTMNQIIQKAILLPEDQRLALAHKLLTASEPECSKDVDNTWDIEICHRIARYDRGKTHSIPVSEVFNELDRRLKV